MTLTVVLVQAMGGSQEPVTSFAEVVFFEAMCDQLFVVIKVGATFATVVMSGALDVVLFESLPRVKILITIIAVVVIGRVHHVLAVRGPAPEIALAGSAIGHPGRSDVPGKQ